MQQTSFSDTVQNSQRWGFPGKQSPAYKNPALIARVKELWEKNTTQKGILDAVQAEGFQINDRELMRLRSRFKWFLRERKNSSGSKHDEDAAVHTTRKKAKRPKLVPGNGLIDQIAAAILQEASLGEDDASEEDLVSQEQPESESPTSDARQSEPLDPAETLRRQLRQQQLQAESDEKWRARKRRRRTRGWAGLPADAPGEPPRFPSETTLDESKAYLNLDNKLYAQLRDQFQAMCREQGVSKKTVAGPQKWTELLQHLIRENAHLSTIFQLQSEALQQSDGLWKPKNYKTLSLDVICQDVTKRMRVMETRMGIPEAKNALNLNPSQTREVKTSFYNILKGDHFTNKFEAGDQHWTELKQRWVQGSELLKHAITPYEHLPDTERAYRLRAIEVLARDVMKRLRAENTRIEKGSSGAGVRPAHRGPGPGPAPPSSTVPHASSSHSGTTRSSAANTSSHLARQRNTTVDSIAPDADFQIDPSLLLAASDAATLPLQHHVPTQTQHQSQHLDMHSTTSLDPASQLGNALPSFSTQVHASFLHAPSGPPAPTATSSLPIYFRLHARSTTPFPNRTVWLSVFQGGGVDEVKQLAAREHPGSVVLGLEGVVGHGRGEEGDGEVTVGIDDDGELGAYLGHVGATKGR
ncbi:hypothetical protein N0V90_009418 [Kalmusia sp. IMI 367209]|nr:hypothetical protein N0V90_009418 [Kalmusia sp. IMI 367209]